MGILQARILEWVAMPSSRGSSQHRDQTQVSHIAGGPYSLSNYMWDILFCNYIIVSTILLVTTLTKITHFISSKQRTRIHETKNLNFFPPWVGCIFFIFYRPKDYKNKYFPRHLPLIFSHSVILKIGNKDKLKLGKWLAFCIFSVKVSKDSLI